MALQPSTPPAGEIDDFARIINELLLGLGDAMKSRTEALKRPKLESGYAVDESSRQFRAQAVQSVRRCVETAVISSYFALTHIALLKTSVLKTSQSSTTMHSLSRC
jgi:hypothetical protein